MAIIQNLEAFVQSYPAGLDSVTDLQLSQNENGRQIRFTIGGVTIPAGSVATISGTKPDGVVYSNTGTIEGADTVIFDEDVQMTAVFGTWYAKIRITNAGNTIASARVRFIIDKDPVDAGAIPSESQLDGLVAEAEEYAEAAEDAAERAAITYGSPLTASTASAMTDINRVYVYTGSESGYTYGDWYYYNGSAWVSGGVYNSAAVETDTTLTEPGVPADAKATGDKIDELKDDLDHFIEDFGGSVDDAVDYWLDEHPEATTTVQDGSLTEAKFSNALKLATLKDYVTPEMFGAVGDGVTDDTVAFQDAIDEACNKNGVLQLVSGKNYKLSQTINITARMILDGSGAKVTSTAEWAFYVHSTNMWDGEYTVLRYLYLICDNGIKIASIRTQLLNSRIQNESTAISILIGSYETFVDNCYLVSFTGQSSIGVECSSSDIIFTNITGYGQKVFIKNYGTSSIFNNIHGWPLDADYDGSIFFYENSASFSATLFNCHSDTYQYAIRSTYSMNHIDANIKNFICNWANKSEGWLFYAESDTVSKWAFMKADVILNTLPITFHLCNHNGAFCLSHDNFIIDKTEIDKGNNCYLDNASIIIDNDVLDVFLAGSVDTSVRTDLELYIPYCTYWGKADRIPVIINNQVYNGQIVKWGGDRGRLKVQCSQGFTASSGYVTYVIYFTKKLSFTHSFSN